MASKKVQVVVKATGRKQWVPERWLGHPVLGRGIELPPSARAASDIPNLAWRKAQLESYAAEHGIDVTGATNKTELLEAIEASTNPTNPDATQATDETPATGDKE